MSRTRVTTAVRPRIAPIIAAAFLAAAAAILASSAAVRAGTPVTCSVLVSSTNNPVPAESATIMVGEQGSITGSGFSPDTELEVSLTMDGVPQGMFPQMTDGSGNFVLSGTLMEEQIGVLVLTFNEPNVCSDTVTVTVVAAPAASTEGLPDAAMEPFTPAPASGGSSLVWAALLAVALGWSAVLEVRFRRRTG
ncbi:MAG: hypothetical protein EHM90_05525 [Chloroflexi bacterium]|nr:MAG: hypothetical protein EHM90_05525 [Chloroflexota bacterium]